MRLASLLGEMLALAALALSVLIALASCLGLLRMRGAMDRLHFTGPVGLLSPLLLAFAVLVSGGDLQDSVKSLAIALLLALGGPVLTHVTARAVRARETGALQPEPGEQQAGPASRRDVG